MRERARAQGSTFTLYVPATPAAGGRLRRRSRRRRRRRRPSCRPPPPAPPPARRAAADDRPTRTTDDRDSLQPGDRVLLVVGADADAGRRRRPSWAGPGASRCWWPAGATPPCPGPRAPPRRHPPRHRPARHRRPGPAGGAQAPVPRPATSPSTSSPAGDQRQQRAVGRGPRLPAEAGVARRPQPGAWPSSCAFIETAGAPGAGGGGRRAGAGQHRRAGRRRRRGHRGGGRRLERGGPGRPRGAALRLHGPRPQAAPRPAASACSSRLKSDDRFSAACR